jgi:hypothetical protein
MIAPESRGDLRKGTGTRSRRVVERVVEVLCAVAGGLDDDHAAVHRVADREARIHAGGIAPGHLQDDLSHTFAPSPISGMRACTPSHRPVTKAPLTPQENVNVQWGY